MNVKLPLVVVEWLDARVWPDTPVSATDVAGYHKPEPVTTLGWVLQNDEVGISLATELYDDQYRGRTFIPKAMIVSVTRYKLSKVKAPKPSQVSSQTPSDPPSDTP